MSKHKQQSVGGTAAHPALNEQALSSLKTSICKDLAKGIRDKDTKKSTKRKRISESLSVSPRQRKKQQSRGRHDNANDGKRLTTKSRNNNTNSLSQDALLEEIRALGGDEDDMKLIRDLDSDQEEACRRGDLNSTVDGKLKSDLAAFAAQLGLQQYLEVATIDDGDENSSIGDDDADDNRDDEDREVEKVDATDSEVEESVTEEVATQQQPSKKRKDVCKKQFVSRVPGPRRMELNPYAKLRWVQKFEPRANWYDAPLNTLPEPTSSDFDGYMNAVNALRRHASTLLEAEASAYSTSVLASSSHKFISTIMSSGTLSDKVSALTLAIQESPLHNVKAFESLLGLASKRSRGQAIGALGALVDLLGPGLVLPPNRRLRSFQSQPGLFGALQKSTTKFWSPGECLPGGLTEAHLIQWAYEDWLKTSYFKVIQLLEVWCNDEIGYSRTRSLDFVYGLLRDKPEQETNLLRLLVNKIGDKDRKIASRVSYLLLQLQNTHPGMKRIIIKAIEEEVLLRPGQTFRAKYHATNTLNQTILSNREVGTAETLLRIYFDVFVTLLNSSALGRIPPDAQHEGSAALWKDSSVSTERQTADKLVTAVLTGINRAVPFVSAQNPVLESQVDTLFRIAHSTNFNTSIQALILIQQLSVSKHLSSDRFYRTLYESLLDPRLVTSSKQALYLNLLLRSLKADIDARRVKAFAKRMLQVLNIHQPAFACGLLYAVFQMRLRFPDLKALLEEPEDNYAEDELGKVTEQGDDVSTTKGLAYDGRKRNPEHSNAQNSCLWEVLPHLIHFHPTVSLLAASLFSDEKQMVKPDLESHSLIRFLDKFVYRNPKVADTSRGASIMQPVLDPDSNSIWLTKRTGSSTSTLINSPNFWNKKVEQVAAEDIFFHEYFKQAGKKSETGKKAATTSSDVQNDEDDEAEQEDEIWEALTASHPDGPIDSDESELGIAGFDDSDDSSDGGIVFSEASDDELAGRAEDHGNEHESDKNEDMDNNDSRSGLSGLSIEGGKTGKGSREGDRCFKRRLKDLPMFASADDYAELLDQEEDD